MDPIEFEQDLRDVSDVTLDELHSLVAAERGRRDNLRRIPEQVAELARSYRDGGGDEQALTDALNPKQAAPRTIPMSIEQEAEKSKNLQKLSRTSDKARPRD